MERVRETLTSSWRGLTAARDSFNAASEAPRCLSAVGSGVPSLRRGVGPTPCAEPVHTTSLDPDAVLGAMGRAVVAP